jgi:DNA-binding CsgD family transcriptional regulator
MQWVRLGKSNWEVGQIIGCVEQTVKKHMQNIFRKLGVQNRISAINELRA